MKMHLQRSSDANLITAYAPGSITINEHAHHSSLVVAPRWLVSPWAPARFEDLQTADFTDILEHRPEVLLLGTGRRLRFPPAATLAAFRERQIGVEVMDTAAACRTYNILMGEDREVIAALLLIETD